jgi:hypothetical protein
MRITRRQLTQIIREELTRSLNEADKGKPFPPGTRQKAKSWKTKMISSKGVTVRTIDLTSISEGLFADMVAHVEEDPGACITLTSPDGKLGPYTLINADEIEDFSQQPRAD